MHNRGTIIEGIGDDVVVGLSLFVLFLLPVIGVMFLWQRQRAEQQHIHPDSQDTVRDARARLQQQNRVPPGAPNGYPAFARNPRRDVTCPICIGDSQFAIETNCGHVFCGNCIVTYWRHGTWLGAVACPVCRQQVTILLFNFSDEENSTPSPERDEIVQSINRYNRRFSGEPRALIDVLRDLPTLLRHCLSAFFSVSGLMWMFRLRVIICFFCALLYFISPLDIIPEAAFGIMGFIDDLFILLLLAIYVSIIYRQYVMNQAGGGQ